MIEIENIPAKPQQKKTIRVAAYARVSSDKDAAFHSLEAQKDYYEQYVAAHPDWELVGLYSDNAISGTTINRPEFQRMIQNCRDGLVDLIITKSVTRFARNTVILLETIRELKDLGVDCYFEKEDMHSISPDGELLLTLLAMYAEEEARSASENQKWRIKNLYDQGKPAGGHLYGYRWENGTFVIIPDEANVVRDVFNQFLDGKGYITIAKTLNKKGIPSRYYRKWSSSSIKDMVFNEKYAGDLVLQKVFRENFRTKKKRKNNGEMRKVIVRNAHEPIIDRKTYEAVQCEIRKRNVGNVVGKKNNQHDKAITLFGGLIFCGDCGARYQLKHTSSKKYDKLVWACNKMLKYGSSTCRSQMIPNDILEEKTREVLDTTELNREVIERWIHRIDVPERNHLIFTLHNGDIVDVPWEHRSRRESWTP